MYTSEELAEIDAYFANLPPTKMELEADARMKARHDAAWTALCRAAWKKHCDEHCRAYMRAKYPRYY